MNTPKYKVGDKVVINDNVLAYNLIEMHEALGKTAIIAKMKPQINGETEFWYSLNFKNIPSANFFNGCVWKEDWLDPIEEEVKNFTFYLAIQESTLPASLTTIAGLLASSRYFATKEEAKKFKGFYSHYTVYELTFMQNGTTTIRVIL